MSFAKFAIASFLATGALCAQPASIGSKETERVRQLLGSAQLMDKAWGAYLAGHLHSDDLNELLIEQFRQSASLRNAQGYNDEHAFLAVLFDAAIEAGITVPAAVLEPFEEDWTDPVLILLARDSQSEAALLRIRDEKSQDVVWLAANNLLFERKSQPWYTAVLGEVSITHRFSVRYPNDGIGCGGSGHGGGAYRDGVAAMPKGFPPVILYTLQDSPQKDTVLLAPGPHDVYYRRTIVPTDKQVGVGSSFALIARDEIRTGYLAQLAHLSADRTDSLLHSATDINYTSAEDFARAVEQNMKTQEQGIREFIQAIGNEGLRAPGVHLRIVPEVIDKRQNARGTLPAPLPRDIDLE